MTDILQYGAGKLFDNNNENGENEENNESENNKTIEEILKYSINKTESINSHLKSIEEKMKINNLALSQA